MPRAKAIQAIAPRAAPERPTKATSPTSKPTWRALGMTCAVCRPASQSTRAAWAPSTVSATTVSSTNDVGPFGVHDQGSNVSEWVYDGYDHYPEEAVSDPTGAD